jgi:hypothetical protein
MYLDGLYLQILIIEGSRLLGCDTEEVNGSSLKMKALYSFKTSGTVHPMAQCHIAE